MISEHFQWGDGGKALQCRCCGDLASFDQGATLEAELEKPHTWRCQRHKDRNPCLVEGCKRTHAVENRALRDDQFICTEHWRRYVPAGSRIRRAYNAHFRRGKNRGWNDARARAFDRFWNAVVRMVRRRSSEGHIDMAEINKIMGWPNDETH